MLAFLLFFSAAPQPQTLFFESLVTALQHNAGVKYRTEVQV